MIFLNSTQKKSKLENTSQYKYMQEKFPDYNKIISDNMKALRLSRKLSQEQFAEKLVCSREYISRLENYHEKMSLQMLLEIAKIFDIAPQEFFTSKNA